MDFKKAGKSMTVSALRAALENVPDHYLVVVAHPNAHSAIVPCGSSVEELTIDRPMLDRPMGTFANDEESCFFLVEKESAGKLPDDVIQCIKNHGLLE